MRARRTIAPTAIAAALLLVGACANDRTTSAPPPDLDVQLVASLQPFDACDDFLGYVKDAALDQVSAYGLDGGYGGQFVPVSGVVEDAAAPTAAGRSSEGLTTSESAKAAPEIAADSDGAGAATGTGTNNQEAGVDEADIVKTDGKRILTLRGTELIVVTLTDGAPFVTSRLDLGSGFSGDRLFLLADRAYVLGYQNEPMDGPSSQGSELGDIVTDRMMYVGKAAIVEVSLVGDPTVAHRTVVDGNILDGRLADGTVRLVLSTPGGTGLGFVYPTSDDQRSNERAEATNRSVVEESTLDQWVPSASTDGGTRAPLLDCDHLYRPAELSGFSMLSILTISDGLGSLTGSGVLADGQVTYASTDHLYVATNQWQSGVPDGAVAKRAPGSTDQHTDVHSFAIAGSAPATYEASGRVDGHVLNQYSMSEAGDVLRIATTIQGNGGGMIEPMPMPIGCPPDANCPVPEATETSETAAPSAAELGDSRIVVLRRNGEALEEIGKVGGLGATEQIKSVRYVGDIAYVVTFRQTDPFYVVDLSDPTSPKVMGELKVPGFSSYLHPVGDHLVLGVGSDAGDTGRVTGGKLSLYDTSDPVHPKELDSWVSPSVGFMVDGDPHAFNWDAERGTAYLPYYGSCFDSFADCGATTNGVLVVTVSGGAITEVGRLDHADRTSSPIPAPPVQTTTTTEPEATTTTGAPTTTLPEETTTTEPATTVPTTEPAGTTGSSGSGASGSTTGGAAPSIAVGEPMPVDPGIGCDPAACDPMPVPYGYSPTISRVFVIGDRIITLSDAGIAAHDVADRRLVGFAAF